MGKGKFIDRTGEVFWFTDGTSVEILHYFKWNNITVKFCDGTIICNCLYSSFINGIIKHPFRKTTYEIGFVGIGKFKTNTLIYKKWASIFQRCYSIKSHIKKPSYKNCTVHPEWHNFQVFAKWHTENYVEGFELDKDILVKGNKVYGPETCCFVPSEINGVVSNNKMKNRNFPVGVYFKKGKYQSYVSKGSSFKKFLGCYDSIEDAFLAYKTEKEKTIKFYANKHKESITSECYNALINWTVNIND